MKRDVPFSVEQREVAALPRGVLLAVALAVVSIVAIYRETAESIVAIWIRSETFAHGFVVVPLCIWLAWRKRRELARVEFRPWWPGLLAVAATGALGFAGAAARATVVEQFALAFMVQAAIVTVVGLKAARLLVFPLAFLLFAVPAGEFLIPTLIDRTADFTISALRLSGIPVYREGNQFIIPSGAWSVVEQCSGIRYIIASLMVGTIYAAIAYRSTRRRVLFIVASIIVPVVANWARAYLIVMLAHLSGNKIAVGVDHLIYGWIFFGLVMMLLFWVGSFWQEDDTPPAPANVPIGARVAGDVAESGGRVLSAALAAIVAAGVWQPLGAAVEREIPGGTPVLQQIAGGAGWEVSPRPISGWTPRYSGYTTRLEQTFAKDGRQVGVYIAYYRGHGKGRELITSANALVAPEDWDWKLVASGSDTIDWAGSKITVDHAEIVGKAVRLEVFDHYWIGGRSTPNAYVGKALQAWARLVDADDDAALVVLYTPARAAGADDDARAALRDFAAAMSPMIERSLDSARRSAR